MAAYLLAKAASLFGYSSDSIRKTFVTQLENWTKRDFIKVASDEPPTANDYPPNRQQIAQPDPAGKTLDEPHTQIFVQHLIKKWKARNLCIVTEGATSRFVRLVDLGVFAGHLKAALNKNKYIKPFVKQNHVVNNWADIFDFVQYDADKTMNCFQEMNQGNPLSYEMLEKNITTPLGSVLGDTVNAMFGI
jgi:hypothetical protein